MNVENHNQTLKNENIEKHEIHILIVYNANEILLNTTNYCSFLFCRNNHPLH